MFPSQTELDLVIRKLHESQWKAVVACTGAGAGLQDILWSVPGASATLLDAIMPYDRFALADFIGREPEKYCSRDTALWMATAAYRRAKELALRNGSNAPVLGLGLTATVATGVAKKGDHRAFVAVKTANETATVSITLTKGRLDRVGEGRACDLVALDAMLAAVGLPQVLLREQLGISSEEIVRDGFGDEAARTYVVEPRPEVALAHLTDDVFARPLFMPDGTRLDAAALDPATHLIFPGSYHPLHYGHEAMALQAERMTGKKVVFSITAQHPDKGTLSEAEMLRRAEQFRWAWPVLFMKSGSLYVDKAEAFPGFGFLIGADAALGILDPKYYGGEDGRDRVLQRMRDLGTAFHVVGRQVGDRFMTHEDLPVPARFEKLFRPVSGRWDVRSRDLR